VVCWVCCSLCSPCLAVLVWDIVSVVDAMVCVAIRLLLRGMLILIDPLGVPDSILLVRCGLPGVYGSITTGVCWICRLVESSVSCPVPSVGVSPSYLGVG